MIEGMDILNDLKHQADEIGAYIYCDECYFEEAMSAYLDRDGKVDLKNESITFECPACDNETVQVGRGGTSRTVVVNGLDELARVGEL